MSFERSENLAGVVAVPPDKSISHRAAILTSLCKGKSRIENYSPAADCSSTLRCLRKLDARLSWEGVTLLVEGRGENGFDQPGEPLDCGNSATTMRLLAGALVGDTVEVTLTGDESLTRRPMGRIIEPLALMGARVEAEGEDYRPPLRIKGGKLKGIVYSPSVVSAQVKSAILLAGLKADGSTTVNEKVQTRDHTERMLLAMGIKVLSEGLSVTVEPGMPEPSEFDIPGDFSSAAFLITAALVCAGSEITINAVGVNPSRTAFLDMLNRMGAEIEVKQEAPDAWEPRGEITVKHGPLTAIEVDADDVAKAIDEMPLLALLATQAEGRTEIRGADELRHKESDRLRGTVEGLSTMGASIEETPRGMVIEGPCALDGTAVSSQKDHRLAMMLAVAGLAAEGRTDVQDWEWTEISYPGFHEVLRGLGGRSWSEG